MYRNELTIGRFIRGKLTDSLMCIATSRNINSPVRLISCKFFFRGEREVGRQAIGKVSI